MPLRSEDKKSKKDKTLIVEIIFLFILCLFLYFFATNSYGLLDKDEPRYCGTALQIIKSNNWIIPQFNFEDRFDKPILFYWLIALAYKVFGVNAFISRLPSTLCALLCVIFTWYVARIAFTDKKVALISSLVLATSIEYIILGRRAATDMALCLFFSASLYSLYFSFSFTDSRLKVVWSILAGVFIGLSVLTKGPVGIVLPFLILALFLFFRKQFNISHLKICFIVVFFALLVALPWYLIIHNVTNGNFTRAFFIEHNVNRFTSIVGEHPGPFWFYIPVILGGFMPWSMFLVASLINIVRNSEIFKRHEFVLFSFIWIFVVFLFFSFSTTKLATYILIIFPPMALITGYWLCVTGYENSNLLKKLSLATTLCFLPALGLGLYKILRWKVVSEDQTMLLTKLGFSCLLLILGLTLSFLLLKKYNTFLVGFTLSISVPIIVGISSYLPVYYKYSHNDLSSFAILAKKSNAKEIISFGMYRPSLVYYSEVFVDFSDKKFQIQKIKNQSANRNQTYIIGHTSDLSKHSKLFQSNISIIQKEQKYFIGRLI